jgi:obg-like ATPase 1
VGEFITKTIFFYGSDVVRIMAAIVDAAGAKKGIKGANTGTEGPKFGRVKSNLKMGILGLPNVGKSSLFNLLTKQSAAAENYPFCTIEPNEARCLVPDARFDFLCDLFSPPSKIPAYLQVTDIAGIIRGASEGAGLGNAFLSHIASVDGLFHVVRAFDNEAVIHVDDSVDPIRDMETIIHELVQKDIKYIEKQRAAAELEIKKDPKKKLPPVFFTVMDRVAEMLAAGQPLRGGTWTNEEVYKINELIPQALTLKPIVYLVNLDSRSFIRKANKWLPLINTWVKEHGGGQIIPMSVEWEQGLWDLREDPDAQKEYMKGNGVPVPPNAPPLKSCLQRCVKVGYNVLGLKYFFTAGDTECRCWTIPHGALAPEAAGVIHTDFERGFIKAEVVSYEDFHSLCDGKQSMAPIKAAGRYRQEGKTYEVQDGDIIHFMFNVTASKKK